MLEKINMLGFELISKPNQLFIDQLKEILKTVSAPIVGEVGTGVGATSKAIATTLDNRGELHLYDFVDRAGEIARDLKKLGFSNVHAHENTRKYWDSYNWSLMKELRAGRAGTYDLVFLDGAHTFHHDALAFVLIDRLLKPGGVVQFDDHHWRFADSETMKNNRNDFMTKEQIESAQVALVIEILVDGNDGYECIVPKKVWRRRADDSRRT